MRRQTHTRETFEPEATEGIENNLVLFDGVCVLCSAWVQFILKRDAAAQFQFASIQGVPGAEIARRLGIDPADPATNAVVLDRIAYFKSDSALAVLGQLRGWRWTRVLKAIPRPVRDWVYDRIAQSRFLLFGRTMSCMLPTARQRARFLDFRSE